jgi:transposase
MKTDDSRGNEEIAMIIKLVSNDNNNSFKLPLYYIFLEDTKHMTILTRQERERLVLDLYYNQGKTYREISKEARISPRDIGVILNKAIEEKTAREEGIKQDDGEKNQEQEQQRQVSLSAQAYKLFSKGKLPLEVAVTLNLGEPAVTNTYREYWELKRLHILNSIYKETNAKLGPFLKLYRLIKEKGMSIEQVVNAVEIAIHKLPYIENPYGQVKDEGNKLQYIRQGLLNDIAALKYKISALDKTAFSGILY